MSNNLFPAILLAGPPHCGKSVLAFLLTQRLRELGIAHYLLRAVPDGEGDWFLTGDSNVVQTLRAIHKVSFTSQFIEHMRMAIESRLLPLLVDVGGRPQGEQLGILRACSNYILLHHNEQERLEWRKLLDQTSLTPIAELQSVLDQEEKIQERQPFLRGMIGGLEREAGKRKAGMTFGALLERVAGICTYDAIALEQEHRQHAPFPMVNERELAKTLSVPVEGERTIWSPQHLTRLTELVPAHQPLAIYGRGPVWLGAALATRALPSPCAIFDARYGWLHLPEVRFDPQAVNLAAKLLSYQKEDRWLEIELDKGTREPDEIILSPIEIKGGIVISGKLPRWMFATLARALAPDHEWVAVDDPRLNRAIVVHSRVSEVQAGDVLPRLVQE